MKQQAWLWNDLRNRCDLSANWGRPREPGHWELVALAFVSSGHVDLQPWWDSTTPELWRECGFADKPPYNRVWRRVRELERCEDALIDAIAALVQKARQFEPRVGAHVHIDGTEDETHAALIHDCPRGNSCPRRNGPGRQVAKRPQRESTRRAQADRQRENAEPNGGGAAPRTEIVQRRGRDVKRIKQNGCWYRTIDRDAGIRAYTTPHGVRRFWSGYYNQKAIDHFTGGVLFATTYNASMQEYDTFPDLYEKVTQVIGQPPETIIADKGQSVARVFELCARNGTAPIMPWRPSFNHERHDKDTHDRHGIARCRHCGGPTGFRRFGANGNPRLWFHCLYETTNQCQGDQSINCSTDWRLLIPLWRTDPLYHELRASLGCFEGAHDYWRDRYRVGANTLANRPKAIGIGCHRLRALVACVIEWLRICHREGWLGSPRRNMRSPRRPRRLLGVRNAESLVRSRAINGLLNPYGRQAAALHIGKETPPSRRARGQPPRRR